MSEKLTKRKLQAVETKKRIYSSAVELFKTRSFEEISVKDICENAGVSVGVFYHYYKSKNNIFEEGYVISDSRLDEYMKVNNSHDTIENINHVVKFYVRTIAEMGPIYRNIFLEQELINKPKLSTDLKRPLNAILLKNIIDSITLGILHGNALEIFNHISRVIKGTVYFWALSNGTFDVEDETIRLVNIVLDYYKMAL